MESIWNIAQVVVGFGFIIAIHELGHFLAAKRAGITCPAFSVGFPLPGFIANTFKLPERWRNIIAFQWKGTEYRLGWIPFGGYVQMKGQSDTPQELDGNGGDEDDFRNVSYFNKVLVICGGVIMNAITAILFFILAFWVFGVTFIDPVVGSVQALNTETGEPVKTWIENEIQPGDRIIEVEGQEIVDFEDVLYSSLFSSKEHVEMLLERPDGERYRTQVPLIPHHMFDLSVPPLMAQSELVITEDEAKRSGNLLQEGDQLIAINGKKIVDQTDLKNALADVSSGEAIKVKVLRKGETLEAEYQPLRRPYRADNYILGFALESPVVLSALQAGKPADQAGLQVGDQIKALKALGAGPIRGADSEGWRQVRSVAETIRFIRSHSEAGVRIRVERSGKEIKEFDVFPREQSIGVLFSPAAQDKKDGQPASGGKKSDVLEIVDVIPGSIAEGAGLKAGMHIIDVLSPFSQAAEDQEEGAKKQTLEERLQLAFARLDQNFVAGDKSESLVLSVQESNRNIELKLQAESSDYQAFMSIAGRPVRSEPRRFSFVGSIERGFYQTHKKMTQIFQTLGGLFSGQVSPSNLAGPVMIAKLSYDLSEYGFGTLLFFLGFISINLAVINILPVPVLDGGLLLIVTIEKIKGSPLNEKVMGLINFAGFLLIIGLMLFVVFNDIRNLLII